MSESYSSVRGQLKLKGKAGSQFKKKKKRKRGDSSNERTVREGDLKHGQSKGYLICQVCVWCVVYTIRVWLHVWYKVNRYKVK